MLGSAKIHSLLQEMLLNNKNIPFPVASPTDCLNDGQQNCSGNDVSNLNAMDNYERK